MIFKEDSILFPMSLDTLTEDEWISDKFPCKVNN